MTMMTTEQMQMQMQMHAIQMLFAPRAGFVRAACVPMEVGVGAGVEFEDGGRRTSAAASGSSVSSSLALSSSTLPHVPPFLTDAPLMVPDDLVGPLMSAYLLAKRFLRSQATLAHAISSAVTTASYHLSPQLASSYFCPHDAAASIAASTAAAAAAAAAAAQVPTTNVEQVPLIAVVERDPAHASSDLAPCPLILRDVGHPCQWRSGTAAHLINGRYTMVRLTLVIQRMPALPPAAALTSTSPSTSFRPRKTRSSGRSTSISHPNPSQPNHSHATSGSASSRRIQAHPSRISAATLPAHFVLHADAAAHSAANCHATYTPAHDANSHDASTDRALSNPSPSSSTASSSSSSSSSFSPSRVGGMCTMSISSTPSIASTPSTSPNSTPDTGTRMDEVDTIPDSPTCSPLVLAKSAVSPVPSPPTIEVDAFAASTKNQSSASASASASASTPSSTPLSSTESQSHGEPSSRTPPSPSSASMASIESMLAYFSRPLHDLFELTAADLSFMEGLCFGRHMSQGARSTMEDTHVVVEHFDALVARHIHHWLDATSARRFLELPQQHFLDALLPPNRQCFAFSAVYDGHGGDHAALFCERWLHHNIARHLALPIAEYIHRRCQSWCDRESATGGDRIQGHAAEGNDGNDDDDDDDDDDHNDDDDAKDKDNRNVRRRDHAAQPPHSHESHPILTTHHDAVLDAMARGVMDTEAELVAHCLSVGSFAGSVIVCSLVLGQHMYLCHAGDSRAVLSRAGTSIQLTEDHRPTRDDERQMVEALGGCVEGDRVNGELAVSRALGDIDPATMRKVAGLNAAVETRKFRLHPAEDEFVIVASDGLWDGLSNEKAVAFARGRLLEHQDIQRAARELVAYAVGVNNDDNITAVLIGFSKQVPGTGDSVVVPSAAQKQHSSFSARRSSIFSSPVPSAVSASMRFAASAMFADAVSSPAPFLIASSHGTGGVGGAGGAGGTGWNGAVQQHQFNSSPSMLRAHVALRHSPVLASSSMSTSTQQQQPQQQLSPSVTMGSGDAGQAASHVLRASASARWTGSPGSPMFSLLHPLALSETSTATPRGLTILPSSVVTPTQAQDVTAPSQVFVPIEGGIDALERRSACPACTTDQGSASQRPSSGAASSTPLPMSTSASESSETAGPSAPPVRKRIALSGLSKLQAFLKEC